jgi:replicative DNA helicase
MGKTALATNIAYNVAKAWRGDVRAERHVTVNGGIVGFFSLEMSAEQLATRIIAEQTGIPSSHIRRGGINESDFEKIKGFTLIGAGTAAEEAAWTRSAGHRLPAIAARFDQTLV